MPTSWPPSERTTPVSYIEVSANDAAVEAKTTAINFVGTLMSASSVGGGAVEVAGGIQEYTEDPASPLAGDIWIYHEVLRYTSFGSLLLLGQGAAAVVHNYYLKYRTHRGTTVSIQLT